MTEQMMLGGFPASAVVTANGSPDRTAAATYSGRRIPRALVEAGERVLAGYNEAFGRRLGRRTADGRLSPALRQIVGAMLARPEVDVETWLRAIACVASNPPGWCDGRTVAVGDIFGIKAAEHALANPGRRGDPRRSKDRPEAAARVMAMAEFKRMRRDRGRLGA
jgi:hypothetical protein